MVLDEILSSAARREGRTRQTRQIPAEGSLDRPEDAFYFSFVKKISTDEAETLIDDGVPFIDVRTEEEFADGHVPHAINIPISVASPSGMQPNPDFVAVVAASFEKGEKIVVACKAGGRSARAAGELEAAGFTNVLDMTAGFHGGKDAFGAPIPGWQTEGREVETTAEDEQTYPSRKAKLGR